MSDTAKPRKRWFLMAEVVVLVLVAGVWTLTSGAAMTAKAEVLKAVIRIDPDNTKAMWSLVKTYAASDQPNEVIQECERIIKADPCCIDAYLWLATANEYLGHRDEVVSATKRAVDIAPNNADLWAKFGRAQNDAGNYDEAATAYKKAIQLGLNNAEVYQQLGYAFIGSGRNKEAIDVFVQATMLKANSQAWWPLGVLYADAGKWKEAAEALEHAIEGGMSSSCSVYVELGTAYAKMGRFADAVAAMRRDSCCKDRYTVIGYQVAKAGKAHDVFQYFDKALRGNSQDKIAMAALAWIMATSPDPAMRNPSRAVEYAEKVALSPHEPFVGYEKADLLAVAYASAGRFGDAITSGKEAVGLGNLSRDELTRRLDLYKKGKPYYEEPAEQRAQPETPSPNGTPVAVVQLNEQ